jgi:hypothetical protein
VSVYQLSLALTDIEHIMALGFSELLSIIFLSLPSKDEVIANTVHRMKPFSVADETEQQAQSPNR